MTRHHGWKTWGKGGPWAGVKDRRNRAARDEGKISTRALPGVRREKPLSFDKHPYRKPTQVDEERILRPTEEVLSRNSAKWPRNFGRRGASEEAAETRPKQLFSKNTGLCKAARRRIWADACPVLEGYEEGLAQAKL